MKVFKNNLLFLIDKPDKHCDLIKNLYCLKNVNVMRIKNMNFNQVRNFINRRINCIILLFVEENKGKAITMLHNMYNCSFKIPYVICVFKTNRKKFLEHIKTCGVAKLFCTKLRGHSDYVILNWVKKACNYVGMNVVFPFSQSFANSYVRQKICDKLHKMGMVCYLTGYKYIVDAIELYIDNLNLCITSDIYQLLALKYNTACANIDRCMRHAIEVVWRDTSFECLEKNYPNNFKVYENRPSVLEFIRCLAENIKKTIK